MKIRRVATNMRRKVVEVSVGRRRLVYPFARLQPKPSPPAQFYRLLDQTNYRKSIDQMLALLQALDCDVRLTVRARSA